MEFPWSEFKLELTLGFGTVVGIEVQLPLSELEFKFNRKNLKIEPSSGPSITG